MSESAPIIPPDNLCRRCWRPRGVPHHRGPYLCERRPPIYALVIAARIERLERSTPDTSSVLDTQEEK